MVTRYLNPEAVAADEKSGLKDTVVAPQLTSLNIAQGIEALFYTGAGTGPAMAVKNFARLDIKLPPDLPYVAVNQEVLPYDTYRCQIDQRWRIFTSS